MCGILLYNGLQTRLEDKFLEFYEGDTISKPCDNQLVNHIVPYIAARGPNYSSYTALENFKTCWFSSVLSLRKPFTKQSVNIDNKFVLQFNGELYNNEILDNDTQYITNLLNNIIDTESKSDHFDDLQHSNNIINVLKKLDGEFAFTLFDLQYNKLYFGRDPIGRRSLSYIFDDNSQELYIASVTGTTDVPFLNCIGGTIYIFDTITRTLTDTHKINEIYKVTDKEDSDFNMFDMQIDSLYNILFESVKKRITTIHPAHIENSPISILFSGGLDCSVIAALISEQLRYLEIESKTIELLNVGFENPRTGLKPKDTPDRKLARTSSNILQNLYPEIDIKLIEVDVPYDDYLRERPKVIDLMHPKNTEMDLSIAIAFYFASKGKGFIIDENKNTRIPYQRKGIVLFSGLGADELYGGYHKFANKTPAELVDELTKQINNIHDRNLNRDDKVIANNGVEVRYPFLDEDVVQYSTSEIPINYKINKLILRKLAFTKLNLGIITEEPKRAIQFGAKSAKMTKDGNKNGTDLLN